MWFSAYRFPKLRLDGARIYLRPPRLSDYPQWVTVRRANQKFLQPWEPAWPDGALTRAAFRQRLRHQSRNWKNRRGFAFLIFQKDTDTLIGGINMNNIVGGVSRSATLGYWLAESATGYGYMREAISLILDHAFFTLKLHRMEAACLVNNMASIRTLETSGFFREGLARRYLKINGHWQDHFLYGITKEDIEIKGKNYFIPHNSNHNLKLHTNSSKISINVA